MSFAHIPVLLQEVLEHAPTDPAKILDCTLGGGGHSHALLSKFPEAHLQAIDQDPSALEAAGKRLSEFGDRAKWEQGSFSELPDLFPEDFFDYILADIGVSSAQIDQAHRGFSFLKEGPLDMRMNPNNPVTAEELLQTLSVKELAQIFRRYGEERFAMPIAKRIVTTRETAPFNTTRQLADCVENTIPKKFQSHQIHPATRVFQALRIEVNQELQELEALLSYAIEHLNPGGRVAIITFHSLEDRIVKQQFKQWQNPCQCPPDLPYCVCDKPSLGTILTKRPVTATSEESEGNRRSRSAKLRVFGR